MKWRVFLFTIAVEFWYIQIIKLYTSDFRFLIVLSSVSLLFLKNLKQNKKKEKNQSIATGFIFLVQLQTVD